MNYKIQDYRMIILHGRNNYSRLKFKKVYLTVCSFCVKIISLD